MRLNSRVRGFSLIELLVAVFVIVLLIGVVSLNVGPVSYTHLTLPTILLV